MTVINFSKMSFIFFTRDEFLLEVFFHNFFTIPNFKHFINEFVNRIFTSIFLFRLAKSIIKTYNFVSITITNMLLILISVRFIRTIPIIFLKIFQNIFKIDILHRNSFQLYLMSNRFYIATGFEPTTT